MQSDAEIASQREHIAGLERALWRGGLNESVLGAYQQAYRELEASLAVRSDDRRHHFVVVIPVADSPRHLRNCLDSLLTQLEAYGYGGVEQGRYRKVSVLLADDSGDPAAAMQNRALAAEFEHAGLRIRYFGLDEQLELMRQLAGIDLGDVVGRHALGAFGHKGQAMMRNIAYLKLAELQQQPDSEPLLFYTVDADQRFEVKVATAEGGRCVNAVNYFHELDRLFDGSDLQVLTGKVVGDPPVSPAVMAGRFLDDVAGVLAELGAADPSAVYPQPAMDARGSGEAAYHDMADMFGFTGQDSAFRFRCSLPGMPSNAECLADFAGHLRSFFHGEHPTRITWYRYQSVAGSVQPARTIYTGNYVFTAQALDWFIPFAPLRLRMSGPTMGRILKAELGAAFVSANVPMLHSRTLAATGAAEYRPGVIATEEEVDLADEFERQFFGDVMLFTVERLAALGYPAEPLTRDRIAAELDQVHAEMRERYLARQQRVLDRLAELRVLLDDPARWWNNSDASAVAVRDVACFLDNIERNFGLGAGGYARIGGQDAWPAWRARQLAAIDGLHGDRLAWREALERLRHGGAR